MIDNPTFHDIVQDVELHGRDEGRQCVATCGSCETEHSATVREWGQTALVDDEELRYVAMMRTWACCMDDEEPANSFPDDPRA